MKVSLKKSMIAAAIGMAALQANAMSVSVSTFGGEHDEIEVATAAVKGSFADIYSFTLSTAVDLVGGLFNTSVGAQSVPTATFGLFSVGSVTPMYTGSFSSGISATLAAGDYFYLVTGASGAKGGAYALTSTVSPVPEPETYALFLAGLGAVGFLTARRRSN